MVVRVISNSIIRKDMPDDKWLNPIPHKQKMRLLEIRSLLAHTPTTCPECNHELEHDDCEIYCPECGLVVCDSYPYVAGIHIDYVYGLKLG